MTENKPVTLRQETPADFPQVFALIERAFCGEAYSDHKEQFLVERGRASEAFIPELSLVAENESGIVGYCLLTKIKIKNAQGAAGSLALAPVAVKPEFQGRGIGGRLIKEAHRLAASLGYRSVVILGHSGYYPRFGYKLADEFGIKLPFDVPAGNCMAIELVKDGLKGVTGEVLYAREFFEE